MPAGPWQRFPRAEAALPAFWAVIASSHPAQSSPGNDFLSSPGLLLLLLLLLRARLVVSNSHPSGSSQAQLREKSISTTLRRNTPRAWFSRSALLPVYQPSGVPGSVPRISFSAGGSGGFAPGRAARGCPCVPYSPWPAAGRRLDPAARRVSAVTGSASLAFAFHNSS